MGNVSGWFLRLLRLTLAALVIASVAVAVSEIQGAAVSGLAVPARTEARLAAIETWQGVTGSTGP